MCIYEILYLYTQRCGHAVRTRMGHARQLHIGSTLASRKVAPNWTTKRNSRKPNTFTWSNASLTRRIKQKSTFYCRVVTIDAKKEQHSEGKFSKSADACSKTPTSGRAPRLGRKKSQNGRSGKTGMKK